MKILYHHRTSGEEPESIHIMAIINAFKVLGHDVLLVGPSARDMNQAGSNTSLATLKRMMPAFIFELAQIGFNVVSGLKLRSEVKSYNPDFIYERYALYSFSGVLLASLLRLPLVLEVNTPYAHAWQKYYKIYFPWLARWVEKRVLLAASHIVTVTEVQKQFLVSQGIPADKIIVCHNAIDPQEFDRQGTRHPVESKLPAGDKVVIGFVGTMNRWQGIPVFKQVIPAVLARYPQACFLMVGDGEFKQELEDHIAKLQLTDRVIFTGRIAHREVPSCLRLMDIGVLPNSNNHGSPMKVFEYAAMNMAIVAPRVDPVLEVLKDGETGLLIEPGNEEQMIEKICSLLENTALRHELAGRAKDYVIAHHTWKENAAAAIAMVDKRGS